MEKEKHGIRTAILATEIARAVERSSSAGGSGDFAYRKRGSSFGVAKRQKRAIASAALIAALATTGSTAVLADKGGRGSHLGVPNVNLGLPDLHKAGAGAAPFVPSPKLQVAPGLTLSPGATPPGHLATPGLGLGRGHGAGALPTEPVSVQPGNGLALGHDNGLGKGHAQGTARGPTVGRGRIATTTDGASQDPSQGSEAMPRQLPTCR